MPSGIAFISSLYFEKVPKALLTDGGQRLIGADRSIDRWLHATIDIFLLRTHPLEAQRRSMCSEHRTKQQNTLSHLSPEYVA